MLELQDFPFEAYDAQATDERPDGTYFFWPALVGDKAVRAYIRHDFLDAIEGKRFRRLTNEPRAALLKHREEIQKAANRKFKVGDDQVSLVASAH